MLDDIPTWIEAHEHTVHLLKWIGAAVLAWASGLFSLLSRYKRRPKLGIIESASFVFIENGKHPDSCVDTVRASFALNVSLVNSSNEKIVADQFLLSFGAKSFRRSHSQKLLRFAFPSRPRKRIGEGMKFMGVWFTEYPADEVKIENVSGSLAPRELCGGYLLFSSYTFGSWNPKVENGTIGVRLKLRLTSQETLSSRAKNRVTTDTDFVEYFSPGFCAHVGHETTWNHDLSIAQKSA